MIVFQIRNDGFSVIGHAGYAPIGYDIVCAAVSTLVQTFVSTLEEMRYDITFEQWPLSMEARFSRAPPILFLEWSMMIGLRAIAAQYPDNLEIKEVKQDE